MADDERVIWGIHAGRTGDAEHLFLSKGVIALGWHEVGDLSKLRPEREAFKAAVAATYPDAKPGAIPTWAGQLLRFVHELKTSEIVAYPSKRTREIHLGEVTGPYRHDTGLDQGYPNVRDVRWLRRVPRTQFSQGALYEIGSALSFFQIKTYAEEYRSAVEGKPPPLGVEQDDTVPQVAEEIEQATQDFVLKHLAQELKGYALQGFVAHLLETMGYRTRTLPEGPDGGIDVIAHRDELGLEPPIIKVQVKSSDGSVGDPVVSALYGKVGSGEFGLLVTLGTFTSQAQAFARSKSNLRLIDGSELARLVLQHYESFNSQYKSLLPMRRVYIPDRPGTGLENA